MKETNGEVVSDLNGILDSWHDFYHSLFTMGQRDGNVQERLLENLTARIPADQVLVFEGPLSMAEVFEALKGMAKGKAPGSDGLPPEFYLALWDVLGEDLVEVLNASFAAGVLPSSQRTALISLIFKKGDRAEHKTGAPLVCLTQTTKYVLEPLRGAF